MKTTEITGETLLKKGFPEGKSIGIALALIENKPAGTEPEKILLQLSEVLKNPESKLNDKIMGELAKSLVPAEDEMIDINDSPLPYKVYGASGIEEGAMNQINTAMRLPIARAGALMPDAHQGYGLPIGGVLATENAVIPYAVGVDIGCRMCLSIFDLPVDTVETRANDLKKMLVTNAKFGRETFSKKYQKDHAILENSLFNEIDLISSLKERAANQLGSSGGGNHFVEFGIVDITEKDNDLGLKTGKYFALLSHSGSRGLGAMIANHYTKLAMKNRKLPQEAKHLAWLNLDTEAGQEYWLAMNLAGDYASACHHQIHERMAVGLRTNPIAMVENHHNFAWKEKDEAGNEWIVHRKGATPAGKGVLGIIPGSMTAPGYIVRGKGSALSLNSAAHGAGRAMSRTKAKNTLDKNVVANHIKSAGVQLIGSGLDEAPMAYKNITDVMEAQKDLIDILGTFTPKIVRMCGDKQFREVD